jgi:hypothetical protein
VSETERCWLKVLSTLNETQGRPVVAEKTLELGRGGMSHMAELTGMSWETQACWRDIGRPDGYQRAQTESVQQRKRFGWKA